MSKAEVLAIIAAIERDFGPKPVIIKKRGIHARQVHK